MILILNTKKCTIAEPWSSLVEGGKGSFLPICQTNLVIDALSLLIGIFINTTAYHLGRYEPSSPVSCHSPWLNISADTSREYLIKQTISIFLNRNIAVQLTWI